MARYPGYGDVGFRFGPGALSPAIKLLIITNILVFLVSMAVPEMIRPLGLRPAAMFGNLAIYQLVSYMFLHGGIGHILFNMLALWMFGTELERTWGTRFFTKYYFVTGVGAGVITVLWSLTTLPGAEQLYYGVVIGASGAVYGVLLAYGLSFPHRPIFLWLVFPIPAKYFVMIIGAIAFLSSVGAAGTGVAHAAHLGGLVVGYLYLKGLRARPLDELKYRWLRWKMGRARHRFDVYSGGRKQRRPGDDDDWTNDWKKQIH